MEPAGLEPATLGCSRYYGYATVSREYFLHSIHLSAYGSENPTPEGQPGCGGEGE